MPTDRATVAVRPGPGTTVRPAAPRRAGAGDSGLSLLEVIVALAVIGTVMTAMAPFLVHSMVVVSQQADEQVAVQVANDALERARALKPSSLLVGRGEQETKRQWAAAPAAVGTYLAMSTQDWDPTDPLAGAAAPLPTVAKDVIIDGASYQQQWYVGRCWQPRPDPTATAAAVADCVATQANSTDVPFYRVVVAVAWKITSATSQGSCANGFCVYVAATLVSPGTDLIFDTKRPAPTVTIPANQFGYLDQAAPLQLAATGGWLPRTWTATGLPPGLTLTASTGAIAGAPTAVGSYTVTVVVKDRDNKTDDATFTWTVAQPLVLTAPADQTSHIGTADSLTIAATGGHLPRTWSATGLPPGLSIDTTTGVISGTTTTAQATTPVTVKVEDAAKKALSVTFGWRVLTTITVTDPGTQSFTSGTNAGNFSIPVTGGQGPYTWQATGLPDGLSMSTAGVVTGTATNGTRYVVTVVVTDSAGGTATIIVVCNVAPRHHDLTVTSPTTDRTTTVNAAASGTATALNGAAGRAWSSSGLPPGVTFSTAGVFGGRPTAVGTYIVKLTVNDNGNGVAKFMFTWKVTP